jgi:alkylation response protein AidB-like acyl-CoA dehydrogenase
MASNYKAPVEDLRFALFDVLDAQAQYAKLGFENASRDTCDAVLDEAARFTESVLAPLNAIGDAEGCSYDKATGDVATPAGFKEAYRQFVDAGWTGLTGPEAVGGQGLPESLGAAVKEMLDASNLAWSNFSLLSHGVIEALKQHGEQWQKDAFLRPLIEGRWTGTMCLTESHAGSDLGLLKTRAEPAADGTYSVSGTKIFITAGEHDFTDNIIHLVLARLPDAPAGTKGISLFIVPKFKVARDGSVGERNAVRCGAIEHKMGINGSPTCVINFDGAQGYLIGQPNKGLMAMFTMMNTARLAVGLQGLAMMDRVTQAARSYASERLQGRSLAGAKYPDKPADPIVVHPDVRRMLLTCMALGEGSRVLALQATMQVDALHHAPDEASAKAADDLLGFLTPIVKGCLTEWANECAYHALQCFGGHGYVSEWGIEQLARDARITTIYEGTTGIQAMDLLGRKIIQLQGAGMRQFLGLVQRFCMEHAANAEMIEFVLPLAEVTKQWGELTMQLAKKSAENPEEIGAASVDFLFYSGYATLAYWWARSVAVAEAGAHSNDLRRHKREVARFYFARILPRINAHAAAMKSGAGTVMGLPDSAFGV